MKGVCVYYCRTYYKAVRGGGRRRVDDMCYDRRRAKACVDESARHALKEGGEKEMDGTKKFVEFCTGLFVHILYTIYKDAKGIEFDLARPHFKAVTQKRPQTLLQPIGWLPPHSSGTALRPWGG